ncbi:hypothetical protein CEP53_012254 [Fusarium sp. AF-6]|nr:hypothetical protein CEP53_012254 [Fusarium sp. AF-6]
MGAFIAAAKLADLFGKVILVVQEGKRIGVGLVAWTRTGVRRLCRGRKAKKKATVLALGYDAMMCWKCVLYYS